MLGYATIRRTLKENGIGVTMASMRRIGWSKQLLQAMERILTCCSHVYACGNATLATLEDIVFDSSRKTNQAACARLSLP